MRKKKRMILSSMDEGSGKSHSCQVSVSDYESLCCLTPFIVVIKIPRIPSTTEDIGSEFVCWLATCLSSV